MFRPRRRPLPDTLPELASTALFLLLALIAVLVVLRIRGSGRTTLQSAWRHAPGLQASGYRRAVVSDGAGWPTPVGGARIRPLSSEMRDHFVVTWRGVQAQFVDDPLYALGRADELLATAMVTRGYPPRRFTDRGEDISVDLPMVRHYNASRTTAAHRLRGEATTEDLRAVMVHFQVLFDDLVNEPAARLPMVWQARQ